MHFQCGQNCRRRKPGPEKLVIYIVLSLEQTQSYQKPLCRGTGWGSWRSAGPSSLICIYRSVVLFVSEVDKEMCVLF